MINYQELEKELKAMRPRQRLYELIKAEVKRRGHWKNKKRGWHISGRKVGPPKH